MKIWWSNILLSLTSLQGLRVPNSRRLSWSSLCPWHTCENISFQGCGNGWHYMLKILLPYLTLPLASMRQPRLSWDYLLCYILQNSYLILCLMTACAKPVLVIYIIIPWGVQGLGLLHVGFTSLTLSDSSWVIADNKKRLGRWLSGRWDLITTGRCKYCEYLNTSGGNAYEDSLRSFTGKRKF